MVLNTPLNEPQIKSICSSKNNNKILKDISKLSDSNLHVSVATVTMLLEERLCKDINTYTAHSSFFIRNFENEQLRRFSSKRLTITK